MGEVSNKGIKYGNYVFTSPQPLQLAALPNTSGLYAIQSFDSNCRPQPFRPIYFGETSNFAEHGFRRHPAYQYWVREAGIAVRLYVSFLPTPLWDAADRLHVESQLITRYLPPCNHSPADISNGLRGLVLGASDPVLHVCAKDTVGLPGLDASL